MLELARKAKPVIDKVLFFYSFKLPNIIVWVAFIYLGTIKLPQTFFRDGEFGQVIPIYFSAIGLTIALSSVAFTYSKVTDKDKLVKVGELFLYSGIALVNSFIISWISFEAREFFEGKSFNSQVSPIISLVFTGGFVFIVFAANSLSVAIEKLEHYLFFKIKEDIR